MDKLVFWQIYINQRIEATNYATTAETLPTVCAHELMHYVQDYYYMQLFSDYTIKWWLEATAVQADKFVFPKTKKFEVVEYADNINLNLAKPWDDSNSDPNYYTAGTFLSYLIYHREGEKLSFPKMIKEGGNEKNVSNMRTFLDNLIKSDLGSNGIGEEFKDFIKWAFERKGEIKIPVSRPTPTPLYSNFKNAILKTKYDSFDLNALIPRLSVAFFKGLNAQGEKQSMTVQINEKSAYVDAFVYKVFENGEVIFVTQLNQNESVKVELSDTKKEWAEVVCINKSKEEDGNTKVTFSFEDKPYISSITPDKAKVGDEIKINGSNFGVRNSSSEVYFEYIKLNLDKLDKYLKSWNDNQIVITVPEGATSGDVYIRKDNTTGNKVYFEVLKSAPVIDSVRMKVNYTDGVEIYKPWGFATINSRIRIFGKNWIKDASRTFVRINNSQDAKIITLSDKYIEFEVPSAKGNIQVSVKSDGLESATKDFFVGIPLEELKKLEFLEYRMHYYITYIDHAKQEITISYGSTLGKDFVKSKIWNGNILTISNENVSAKITFSSDGTSIENVDYVEYKSYWKTQFTIKNILPNFSNGGFVYGYTKTGFSTLDFLNVKINPDDNKSTFKAIGNAPAGQAN